MPDDIDTSNNDNQEPANIPSVSLEQEMQKSYLDYAMSVICLLYTSPSPRDVEESRMPSSA